ncbi:MAG: 23S rRNA (adenine(2503)-C(2))-methyltransferase RlmN [Desulfobacterium sp.]|nr:23S rRNA (adenine(2503)-C(2))-methyltransferase RlmN [Desulfobacterium sp.]MBU3947986.1 23S rRNA (adenine(2503)-C(2))-methyltransferase RlmN [Pseudomonadota bacterium]MBU4010485.1 23S rRNA (adenine(2503)-C(2))-methyltransferase RlmN [Pseudomonadota bacterium]MBU4037860.1 23S rRNA (adenine(2503)-C(2))-methyltransferase RlmN [Pseudomonadota bacterium]
MDLKLKQNIIDLTKEELSLWLKEKGIEAYRAHQIFKWIYLKQVDTFEEMTDIALELRSIFSNHFTINRLDKQKIEISSDGSKKYLFGLTDGNYIESVLIPEKNHYTLCISSQVGCAQGCRFCLTARGGFVRNLTKAEIVSQVRDIQNEVAGAKLRLSNIVLMGMGEPLANYKNVIKAIDSISSKDAGLGFSKRKITVSTAGLVPFLKDLGKDAGVNLAVSLNAADNETRDMLMPINRKYPIEDLIEACRVYDLKPRNRITFEYILIKGINDSPADAKCLAKLLRSVKSKINLIPFNEYEASEFKRPEETEIRRFQEILLNNNFTAVIRHSKGRDISAACGQLKARTC